MVFLYYIHMELPRFRSNLDGFSSEYGETADKIARNGVDYRNWQEDQQIKKVSVLLRDLPEEEVVKSVRTLKENVMLSVQILLLITILGFLYSENSKVTTEKLQEVFQYRPNISRAQLDSLGRKKDYVLQCAFASLNIDCTANP